MQDWLCRQRALIGDEGCDILKNTSAAVVGLGGVGSAAAEALVRAGVGKLWIMDFDLVAATDCNRQLIATKSAEGQFKSEVAAKRYLDINPDLQLFARCEWLNEQTVDGLFDFKPDFIIDAIDKVTHKLLLIQTAAERGVDIISSMGTGKRTDPTKFKVGTIEQTAGSADGLARIMRRELRRRGLSETLVLYSAQPPADCGEDVIASISFVPPVAGYIMAGHMINMALQHKLKTRKDML